MDDQYANGQTDPTATPEGGAEAGYCIEIYVYPDGTYKVTREDKPEPPAMEGMEGETDGQTVNSLDQALEIARGLAEGPQEAPMDAARRGYDKARRPQMSMGGMTPAKVFGE